MKITIQPYYNTANNPPKRLALRRVNNIQHMNKIIAITTCLLFALATTGFSQKFGFCNSDALLAQLPEIKAADSELQAFQAQLTKRGQERVKAWQDAGAELDHKKEIGTIAPKEYDAQAAKLEEEKQSIAKYEQEVYTKLGQKREELFKPLLDKVNKAMEAVATENGFALVFDSSTRVLLFAHDTLDVTKMVKAKLGIAN